MHRGADLPAVETLKDSLNIIHSCRGTTQCHAKEITLTQVDCNAAGKQQVQICSRAISPGDTGKNSGLPGRKGTLEDQANAMSSRQINILNSIRVLGHHLKPGRVIPNLKVSAKLPRREIGIRTKIKIHLRPRLRSLHRAKAQSVIDSSGASALEGDPNSKSWKGHRRIGRKCPVEESLLRTSKSVSIELRIDHHLSISKLYDMFREFLDEETIVNFKPLVRKPIHQSPQSSGLGSDSRMRRIPEGMAMTNPKVQFKWNVPILPTEMPKAVEGKVSAKSRIVIIITQGRRPELVVTGTEIQPNLLDHAITGDAPFIHP